jgi:hypothetical protein
MQPIAQVPLKLLVLVKSNPITGGTKGHSPDPIYMRCRTYDRINFMCAADGSDTITHYVKEVLEWSPVGADTRLWEEDYARG